MWPGTQNPIGATGFATALDLALEERETKVPRWTALRERLEGQVIEGVPGSRVHGAGAEARLPHIVSFGLPGCDPGAVLVSLDMEGIAVSGGSACGSDSGAGSPVLAALGIDTDAPYAAIRFSFGRDTSEADIDRAADALIRTAARVLAITV